MLVEKNICDNSRFPFEGGGGQSEYHSVFSVNKKFTRKLSSDVPISGWAIGTLLGILRE